MKWDGIPHHTGLGKGPLFLIYCLSARTPREYARPTSCATPKVSLWFLSGQCIYSKSSEPMFSFIVPAKDVAHSNLRVSGR